jgi:two-component system, NtrC family, response regulator AtoC
MSFQELTEHDADGTAPADFDGPSHAYLLVRNEGEVQVVEVPATEAVVVGRGLEAGLRIEDSRVSRQHFKVFWEGSHLLVEDLGSRNGTLIGGEALRSARRAARVGETIRLASAEITIALVSPQNARDETPKRVPALDGALPGVVVADPTLARVFGFARRVARTSTTALILGETGVGKEVVAQQIHAWSSRSPQGFIRVNCAALPESLAESELFGHERGAFTGADKRKVGFAEAANGGTLFLDEIGELTLPVQGKLLSMLENRAVVRVGSTSETPVDVRVIAATHRDLAQHVADGRFREDLYYRIGVAVIRVPPLRSRPQEIGLLAKVFAERYGRPLGYLRTRIDAEAAAILASHHWPGNVRELRNAIEHAMLLSEDGTVRKEHLPETVLKLEAAPRSARKAAPAATPGAGVKEQLAELEQAAIVDALRLDAGNRTRAARRLGISLRSLLYKIDKYRIGD